VGFEVEEEGCFAIEFTNMAMLNLVSPLSSIGRRHHWSLLS
jgi:hypothetical protein